MLLQAMKEDPPLDARCRDKFLVQSVLIDGTQEADASTIVSLRCFVPPILTSAVVEHRQAS